MQLLTRKGYLSEEQGTAYLADTDQDTAAGAPASGGLHLPHCARAPGGTKSAGPANRPQPSSPAHRTTLCQEAAQKWAPAFENYTFKEKDGVTEVLVDMDIEDEHAEMFNKMWPEALNKLKTMAEKD